jgi:DNA-binding GntR family transcriptional regulator
MTVRRAIRILVDQGIIRTQPGSGTFVQAVDLGFGPRLAELQSLGSILTLPPDDHH